MRLNMPVTQNEYVLPPGEIIITRTDGRGKILWVNNAFIEASGFEASELIGQPQNIVRHPDMPSEAFRDLWSTLREGRPWAGLVKNRRKNGDYYWVRATVTPSGDGEYTSVRWGATRAEITAAQALYEKMNNSILLSLHRGNLVNWGYKLLSLEKNIPIMLRIAILYGLCLFPYIAHEFGTNFFQWNEAFILKITTPALILGTAWALWTVRAIKHPIQSAITAATNITNKNLRHSIPDAGNSEMGMLLSKLSLMQNSLLQTISLIGDKATSLDKAVEGLHATAAQSGTSSEDQVDHINAMAAALEQLSVSIDHIGESSRSAEQEVTNTGDLARDSSAIIQDTSQEMKQLAVAVNASAKSMNELEALIGKISSITQVIGEIAAQTNVLALNAAIVASRAGEHGRGFAVVADEVRQLAERTSNLTMEIKGLIGSIHAGARRAITDMDSGVALASNGAELSNQASGSVENMVERSRRATSSVQEINAALREQGDAARQITTHVDELNTFVCLVQASEKSMVTVSELAEQLSTLSTEYLTNSKKVAVSKFH